MIATFLRKRVRFADVCLAVAMIALVGCDNSRPASFSYSSAQARIDEEFQAGANRPPTAKTLYAMARILASQGKDDQCEFVLVRAIQQYPKFVPAYCELAELRVRQRRVGEAVDILKRGLAHWPNDPVLLNNLGMCMMLKSEFADAMDLFRDACKTEPQNARYRSNMAAALGMMGRYDESLALYLQVVPPAEAHHNLAILCRARKDLARAADEFKQAEALATNSDMPGVTNSGWIAE